jgi:MerR family transcriptional regulator/heat shock protein HspR
VTTHVYVISVVSEITSVHPQTLRTYERLGLVTPGRTPGGSRRYSSQDVETIERIVQLSRLSIPASGIREILRLEAELRDLKDQLSGCSCRHQVNK